MIGKIIGAVSFLAGLLFIVGFPWILPYQSKKMSRIGILIGIILICMGIYLMKT
jgi:hypothetical protein